MNWILPDWVIIIPNQLVIKWVEKPKNSEHCYSIKSKQSVNSIDCSTRKSPLKTYSTKSSQTTVYQSHSRKCPTEVEVSQIWSHLVRRSGVASWWWRSVILTNLWSTVCEVNCGVVILWLNKFSLQSKSQKLLLPYIWVNAMLFRGQVQIKLGATCLKSKKDIIKPNSSSF